MKKSYLFIIFIFATIGILVLPSFRNFSLATSSQNNSNGTFYDNFTDSTAITVSGSADFDFYKDNVRMKTDNNAALIFRGQNGSLIRQAKIKNGYLYAAACAAGLLIYNLNGNPADPALVGQYNTPGCSYDIDFYGNYAILADEYNSDTGVQPPITHQGGLQIIDVSNPANPTFVSSLDTSTGSYSFGATVISHYAYLESIVVGTNNGYLDVYDLSNISSPQLVKSISEPYGFRWRSGLVDGNYLYTAADRPDGSRGLHIFDITDPANPAEVGSYSTGSIGAYAPVSKVGNYIYMPTKQTGVVILDVSNVASPALVATVDTPGIAYNVVVSGNYGYVSDGVAGGLQIFDINTHAITGSYDTPGEAFDVDLYDNYAYVVDSSSIQIINITNPANPTIAKEVKSYIFGDYRGVAAAENYAYIAHSNGLVVYDITNPYSPSVVGGVYLSAAAFGVAISGNYAYVADGADGLKIIDISNPANCTVIGSLDTSGTANKVVVSGNYAYVADGASGMQIINVSDPSNPTSTATIATANYAWGVDLYGHYILLAEGTAGFRIIDITDPTNVTTTATADTPGTAYQVAASGNYAYVADKTSFRVYDISNIASPALKGTISSNATLSVAVGSNNYVYASSQNYGTGPSSVYLTINVSDPNNPAVVDYKYTTGDSYQVALSGGYLYAADSDSGIAVFSNGFTPGSSGQVTSSSITPAEVGSWDKIVINHTLNSQTITYQVLDSSSVLIPDAILPGNSTGFSASGASTTLDVHVLSGTTYPAIKIKANLSTSSNVYTPTVDSWKAYWIKAKAGDDVTSSGATTFDGSSSVGDSYTCAWDFDASDGINWNNPDSTACQASYDYSSKGNGTYTATLRIKQGTGTAYDYDTRVVTVNTVGSEAPVPSTITLSLNHSSLSADSTSQSNLTAEVFDQFNNHVSNGTSISWSITSGSGSLASSSSSTTSGLASNIYTAGNQAGSIIIKACTANLKCDQKTITLSTVESEPVLTTLTISPETASLKINQKLQFTAIAKDQNNKDVTGLTYTWQVSDTNLATITNTGLLTAKKVGTVTVTVSAGTLSSQAKVTITQTPTPSVLPKTGGDEENIILWAIMGILLILWILGFGIRLEKN